MCSTSLGVFLRFNISCENKFSNFWPITRTDLGFEKTHIHKVGYIENINILKIQGSEKYFQLLIGLNDRQFYYGLKTHWIFKTGSVEKLQNFQF